MQSKVRAVFWEVHKTQSFGFSSPQLFSVFSTPLLFFSHLCFYGAGHFPYLYARNLSLMKLAHRECYFKLSVLLVRVAVKTTKKISGKAITKRWVKSTWSGKLERKGRPTLHLTSVGNPSFYRRARPLAQGSKEAS